MNQRQRIAPPDIYEPRRRVVPTQQRERRQRQQRIAERARPNADDAILAILTVLTNLTILRERFHQRAVPSAVASTMEPIGTASSAANNARPRGLPRLIVQPMPKRRSTKMDGSAGLT